MLYKVSVRLKILVTVTVMLLESVSFPVFIFHCLLVGTLLAAQLNVLYEVHNDRSKQDVPIKTPRFMINISRMVVGWVARRASGL